MTDDKNTTLIMDKEQHDLTVKKIKTLLLKLDEHELTVKKCIQNKGPYDPGVQKHMDIIKATHRQFSECVSYIKDELRKNIQYTVKYGKDLLINEIQLQQSKVKELAEAYNTIVKYRIGNAELKMKKPN